MNIIRQRIADYQRINHTADVCAQQYHWLREYVFEHPEARVILGAID
jgi:hypothetical protein